MRYFLFLPLIDPDSELSDKRHITQQTNGHKFPSAAIFSSILEESGGMSNGSSVSVSSRSAFSSFRLVGHEGPVTALLHPASLSWAVDEIISPSVLTSNKDFTSSSAISNLFYLYNPAHLVSGGADFTVRLWNLNPSVDAHRLDRVDGVRELHCLAVFRAHSGPVIGLAPGPPAQAILHPSAGNPRLSVSL
ncbi:unnamed protein product [Protopolystoma xenopodis]|uniref:Uncharacterized protein n=1 Tax=Protopolystoma xenopodis TaxID=117903 RepID=A0A3S5AZX5_9PLAT|nr:unnamed protein product [Protopolystoma xenopodis]